MLSFTDICNTGLTLGLSSFQGSDGHLLQLDCHDPNKKNPSLKKIDKNFPSLTLAVSSGSGASSYSNSSVKRERETSGDQEEVEKVSCKGLMIDDLDEEHEGSARKKLRLTKDQSNILEDSFMEHSTLNPKQKQALATQLNLRPRQVEVWFQNRRARTKLKKTEVEYELLKKCCEKLTDENRRLQMELQEMKAMAMIATPFYMQLPAAPTLIVCPSCDRIGRGGGRESDTNKNHFSVGSKAQLHNHIQC
ncbi:homeobox-leucine zipper protein HAT22-like [Impatiens glandulifera]|uniref:homeobox-leucine zipper protein HAT22-like n=1 Tax=Impatiens glandulifera TaxID=253017 RepID=UPI001FB10B17|nr:homeobox-leucine zipper protein HAT22-like [Impatiens glandulifera]